MAHEEGKKSGGFLAVFREMRNKSKGEKGSESAEEKSPAEEKPPAEGGTPADFKAAADEVGRIAAEGKGAEGEPGGAGEDPAAVVAREAGVSPEEGKKLLDAAARLPEVADLSPGELGRRIKEDFDLRMRLEELSARPGRMERPEPMPMGLPGGGGAGGGGAGGTAEGGM